MRLRRITYLSHSRLIGVANDPASSISFSAHPTVVRMARAVTRGSRQQWPKIIERIWRESSPSSPSAQLLPVDTTDPIPRHHRAFSGLHHLLHQPMLTDMNLVNTTLPPVEPSPPLPNATPSVHSPSCHHQILDDFVSNIDPDVRPGSPEPYNENLERLASEELQCKCELKSLEPFESNGRVLTLRPT